MRAMAMANGMRAAAGSAADFSCADCADMMLLTDAFAASVFVLLGVLAILCLLGLYALLALILLPLILRHSLSPKDAG